MMLSESAKLVHEKSHEAQVRQSRVDHPKPTRRCAIAEPQPNRWKPIGGDAQGVREALGNTGIRSS